MKTIIIIILIIFSMSAYTQNTNSDCQNIEISNNNCIFDQNRVIKENIEGLFQIERKGNFFLLNMNNKNYYACNLPKELKLDKIQVYIKGVAYESLPTEKTIGVPFRIDQACRRQCTKRVDKVKQQAERPINRQ